MTSALAAAFLVAYTAIVSVVLGTLAIALIAPLSAATWFGAFRSRAGLVLATLPALAVIGLILLLALPALYPWVGAPTPLRAYLNVPFFIVRWVIYWASWIAIGASLRAAWRLEDAGDTARGHRRLRRTASAGLVILGLTMTFASFDWMMSLTPDWQSSIYGVYWFAGGVVGALGFLAVLAHVRRLSSAPRPKRDDMHSLAKLLMTFVLFWLYIGFAQYIVIWSADLPKEVSWYVLRAHGGWGALAVALVFGNFVFPFLLLLVESVKRSPIALASIGGALLALHYLDMFWVIMPGVTVVRWWTPLVSAAVLGLVCLATVLPVVQGGV